MLLVNFFAGPGSGKSTTSAYVFARLKMAGINAELVGEEAKDVVYNRATPMLDNQILLLGQQYQRTKRLEEAGIEVALCDSPFGLNAMYGESRPYYPELLALVKKLESLYPNTINVFVKRVKQYQQVGRYQNAEEAAALDSKTVEHASWIHLSIPGNKEGADEALDYISKKLYGDKMQ